MEQAKIAFTKLANKIGLRKNPAPNVAKKNVGGRDYVQFFCNFNKS
ncbi:MAG: hypothetical protein J6C59_01615 [Muribaculaceae bacterium]|nr:hypothetical protein [Muribaculaceae bacterium]